MTIKNALLYASGKFVSNSQQDKNTAKYEAQLLLQHVLNVNRAWLIAHDTDILSATSTAQFEALLLRRLNGEPVAYILGYQEFFGLQLKVSADTLIPRADTEVLVETALEKIPKHTPYHILDLGTGSGAIALAIANNRPRTTITAVDASKTALYIADENAKNLDIHNVHFLPSNWFNALDNQQFDLIVSNPPYIKQHDLHLNQGDLRFEPLSALAAGVDGLNDIRHIINHSPKYLKKNGWLMLEHGYDQANDVAELLAKNSFNQISHEKDLAGILRVTIGRYVAP